MSSESVFPSENISDQAVPHLYHFFLFLNISFTIHFLAFWEILKDVFFLHYWTDSSPEDFVLHPRIKDATLSALRIAWLAAPSSPEM
mmetsp:Transcript_22774/g.55339  ORF Transcript_22774/g.55339 Transcript_22774/m.55339 type:complete len:87 (+) Transcript_22774:179-439(+)